MSVIVTDSGFAPSDPPDTGSGLLDLDPDTDPGTLVGRLDAVAQIRITYSSFSDGRGFTLARRLRLMGFKGHLRASGYILADQYAMARRAGFDSIEIDDALAARQPEDQWRARADWRTHDYQARLRG